MKKILIFIFLVLNNYILFAQCKINYTYVMTYQFPGNTSSYSLNCDLITDGVYSRYTKERVYGGKQNVSFTNTLKEVEEESINQNKNISGDSIGYVIAKDFRNNIFHRRELDSDNKYAKIAFIPKKLDFKILEEFKTILGYKCQKAILEYEKRNFEIWFTPEIPISDGPWILHGLPGLILQVKTNDGIHEFIASSIKKSINLSEQILLFPFSYETDSISLQNNIYEKFKKNAQYQISSNDSKNVKLSFSLDKLDYPFIIIEQK